MADAAPHPAPAPPSHAGGSPSGPPRPAPSGGSTAPAGGAKQSFWDARLGPIKIWYLVVAGGAAFILWKTGALGSFFGGGSTGAQTPTTVNGAGSAPSVAASTEPNAGTTAPPNASGNGTGGDLNAPPASQTTPPSTGPPPANQNNNLPVLTGGGGAPLHVSSLTVQTPGGKVTLPTIAAAQAFNPAKVPNAATAAEAQNAQAKAKAEPPAKGKKPKHHAGL
jgi:hypothetical protein